MLAEHTLSEALAGSPALDVTVIIPVYNGADFIGRALESVLRQDSPVASVLVIDDCSQDATVNIVNDYAARDSRIILLKNTANSGPGNSRNRGLQLANTPIAAFLDADDWWLPEHIGLIQSSFSHFPHAELVFAHTVLGEDNIGNSAIRQESALLHDPLPRLLDENPIVQSSAAVRVAAVLEVGGYISNGRYAEDYELWVRLALRGAQFVEINDVSCVRTLHSGQVSSNNSVHMYRSAWAVRREAVEKRYGGFASIDADAIASLRSGQARDIANAMHTRRRQLVKLVLELSDWVPGSAQFRKETNHFLRWRWIFWRSAAFLYDRAPQRVLSWWRRRRKRTRVTS